MLMFTLNELILPLNDICAIVDFMRILFLREREGAIVCNENLISREVQERREGLP